MLSSPRFRESECSALLIMATIRGQSKVRDILATGARDDYSNDRRPVEAANDDVAREVVVVLNVWRSALNHGTGWKFILGYEDLRVATLGMVFPDEFQSVTRLFAVPEAVRLAGGVAWIGARAKIGT
jgi:hypothetical protein